MLVPKHQLADSTAWNLYMGIVIFLGQKLLSASLAMDWAFVPSFEVFPVSCELGIM